MNQLDIYYRGLLEYRQLTTADRECSALRTAMASANAEQDTIEIKRVLCTVDEEWVKTIEEGLIHVEKAIREERQFIRSNGEVVPIEKVKHVSKESIEHLAKHSNLIARYEEGEEIVPEHLYTVERLSDFTVYENRFLYMLLCYLRDFVMLRYDNILDLTTRYEGKLELSKTVINGKQKLLYTVSMSDVRRQDRYLKENNPLKNVLRRIDFLLKTIVILLEMPLMQEVAKVPMIKPPITKTNVLKMNKNFKGAMALYDYIIAYDKQGYETETQVTTISPFREELADELAEAGSLISFLTYEYGLGIKNDLKASYNKEEERRKLERITQRAEKIKALQRRLRAAEIDIEEYTLTLEKQLRELEGVVTRAQELGAEVERLTLLSEEQVQTIGELTAEIEKLNSEIESLKAAHKAELEALKAAHEAELEALKAAHAEEITAIHTEYEARIVVLHADYQKQLEALRAEQASRIEEMRADYQGQLEAQKAHYTEQLDGVGQELSEKSQAFEALSQSHEALIEEHKIALARIKALGGMDATPMNREDFNRLEEEHKAFERWYASAWKQTKQKIRKDHINMKNFKGQKEQDKSSD